MESQRIDGLKYNFDALSREELLSIRGHLLRRHEQITDDIGTIEGYLFAQDHPELPLGDVAINGAALDPREDVWQEYINATREV